MLYDYSACQVQLSADTLATATSASDLASPASADVRSAAEKCDELAALHSITSSARSGSAGVIANPIFLAVFIFRSRCSPAPTR
jgi:hypothetical protein